MDSAPQKPLGTLELYKLNELKLKFLKISGEF